MASSIKHTLRGAALRHAPHDAAVPLTLLTYLLTYIHTYIHTYTHTYLSLCLFLSRSLSLSISFALSLALYLFRYLSRSLYLISMGGWGVGGGPLSLVHLLQTWL